MKNFKVLTNGVHTATLPVQGDTTVGDITQSYVGHLRDQAKDPSIYMAHLRLTPQDPTLHDLSQHPPATQILFNQLDDPTLYLQQINMFESLPPNVVRQMVQDMPYEQIVNLCLTSQRLNEVLCRNDLFWLNMVHRDYPYLTREDMLPHKGDSWKEYYMKLHSAGTKEAKIVVFEGILENRLDLVKVGYNAGISSRDLNINLEVAASNGRTDIVKYLVEHGADVLFSSEAPVRIAAYNGHLDTVKYLVEHGVGNFIEALVMAAKQNHFEIVKYLVDQGVPITPYIIDEVHDLRMLDYLSQLGVDLHSGHNRLLRIAAMDGNLEMVKFLVERGGNIHDLNDDALMSARTGGHTEVVEYLESLP